MGKTIINMIFRLEQYTQENNSIGQSIKIVALSSIAISIVVVFELLKLIPSLTGLGTNKINSILGFGATGTAIIGFFATIIGSVLFLLISGVVLHIFAYLVGARKQEFSGAVMAAAVMIVPLLLIGWLPIINIWTSIYCAFLAPVYVLAKKQNITLVKATFAIIIPIVIVTLIVEATISGRTQSSSETTPGQTRGMIQTVVPVEF